MASEGGGSDRCAQSTAMGSGRAYGAAPVSASNATQASAY